MTPAKAWKNFLLVALLQKVSGLQEVLRRKFHKFRRFFIL